MFTKEDNDKLAADFERCQKILPVLGDDISWKVVSNEKIYKKKHNTNHNTDCIHIILLYTSKGISYLYQFHILSALADILLYKKKIFHWKNGSAT